MESLGETCLRGIVASASHEAGNAGNIAETIRLHASSKMSLIKEATTLMGSTHSSSLEGAAITAAIHGIEIAYSALSSNLQNAKFMRTQFYEECEHSIATFVLNDSKEIAELSKEENAIKNFWKLIQKECHHFIGFFGIQDRLDPSNAKIHKLSVLPFFQMSQAFEKKQIIASKLDQYRQAIYLFLKTDLPLEQYSKAYQKTSRPILQMEGLIYSSNYLNWFRAPRFIVIAMANLLWNLQHPVDPRTGISLTLGESITLCGEAKAFFDILLDKKMGHFFHHIDEQQHLLIPFFQQVELFIQSLQEAFIFESLHEINLQDVSNSMHRALRVISDKTFELIYQAPHASERVVGLFMQLGVQVHHYPHFISHFFKTPSTGFFTATKTTWDYQGMNPEPASLIDVLILFSHLTAYQRDYLIKQVTVHSNEHYQQIGRLLEKIHRIALLPYEKIAYAYVKLSKATFPDPQRFIAKRFIALIVLMMECFTIFEDTRHKSLQQKHNSLKDKEQRQLILKDADSSEKNSYYEWSLSLFLKNKTKTSENLNDLLKTQYKMLVRTQFLDKLSHLTLNNRIFLQQQSFQKMLIHVLKEICKTYQELTSYLNAIELEMLSDEGIQRYEKRILQPMFDDLEKCLEAVQQSIIQVHKIISAPSFTDEEKLVYTEQITDIEKEYQDIFHGTMTSSLPVLIEKSDTPETACFKKTCLDILAHTINSLSFLSAFSEKSDYLKQLKQKIEQKTTINEAEAKDILTQFIQIAATPTNTYFFKANYAETRSCKALIKILLCSHPQWIERLFSINAKEMNEIELTNEIKKMRHPLETFSLTYQTGI